MHPFPWTARRDGGTARLPRVGAQAMPMNCGEAYPALRRGVTDGGEPNAIGFVSSRLHEAARLCGFTSITCSPVTLLVNEPFCRPLPEGEALIGRPVREAERAGQKA